MVIVGEKEPQGIIAHFYTARLMIAVGKHRLKVSPQFFNTGMFRVFFAKVTVIDNVPPVTLTGLIA